MHTSIERRQDFLFFFLPDSFFIASRRQRSLLEKKEMELLLRSNRFLPLERSLLGSNLANHYLRVYGEIIDWSSIIGQVEKITSYRAGRPTVRPTSLRTSRRINRPCGRRINRRTDRAYDRKINRRIGRAYDHKTDQPTNSKTNQPTVGSTNQP